MADSPTGQWGTLSLAVPDFLSTTRNTINSVAEFLITALEIASAALEIAKAFSVSYIDPVAALVQAIIDEIQGLIDGLRQIGLYIAGDWPLLKYPFAELAGGFAEYERRMVARLTDRTDLTRPNAPSTIKTAGVFFYLSVNMDEIAKLIRFIVSLLRFFNLTYKAPSAFPIPRIEGVKYGTNAVGGPLQFQNMSSLMTTQATPPNVALVSWKIHPAAHGDIRNPFPSPPPGGFLVCVSTVPEGIHLAYDRPQHDATTQASPRSNKMIMPREHGYVRDGSGAPIVLHGGADMIDFRESIGWNAQTDSKSDPQKLRVYGVLNPAENVVVPLEHLKQGDTYFFQRTFYLDSVATGLSWPLQNFSIQLAYSDLPLHAEIQIKDGHITFANAHRPTLYYVRVATVSKNALPRKGGKPIKYNLAALASEGQAAGKVMRVNLTGGASGFLDATEISEFSAPGRMTFPTANALSYINAIEASLLLLLLGRADLPTADTLALDYPPEVIKAIKDGTRFFPGVALQPTNLERFRHLISHIYYDFQKEVAKTGVSPVAVRRSLRDHIRALALDLYSRAAPLPSVEALILRQVNGLLKLTWQDMLRQAGEGKVADTLDAALGPNKGTFTLLGSLSRTDLDFGLTMNPRCLGIPSECVQEIYSIPDFIRARSPHFGTRVPSANQPPNLVYSASPEQVPNLIKSAPPYLKVFYEKGIQKDGSLVLNPEIAAYMETVAAPGPVEGSADMSPVLYVGQPFMLNAHRTDTEFQKSGKAAVLYCRSIIPQTVYDQAALVLGLAAAGLTRSRQDGAWIAVRLFDTLPSIEEFMDAILNWVRVIKEGTKAVADAISQYIEFIEARILDLQNLIQRLDALLASILTFTFALPKMSGLLLLSNGTDGLLSDFMTAENKPSDSPLDYGAGLVVVAPAAPAFLFDLIALSAEPAQADPGQPDSDRTPIVPSPSAIGAEGVPQAPLPAPAPEPDIL